MSSCAIFEIIDTRNVNRSEEYGKCVPILSHFVKKNVTNAKYAFGGLQSPQKRAQSTEHMLITKYDAAEVLITPLELRAGPI